MAHLKPFFRGTTLFSTISPDYEKQLEEELFACFRHIGIPLAELNRMPVRKRKFYIKLFNEEQERRTAAAPPQQKGHRTREISGDDVNKYTGKK